METYINMYKCQNKCIKCIKNQEPRHLFIKKLYFGFFQTFKAYIYIYRFSQQDFHIIPGRIFYLPGEKFTARSHPGKFFKIWNFSRWVKPSPPGYWDRVSWAMSFIWYIENSSIFKYLFIWAYSSIFNNNSYNSVNFFFFTYILFNEN